AQADPCQSRAVKLARQARGLVIHGPPGTGKSQTITNIVGDHLSRGDRVLLVSDKRTALDVVANRLEHMGLGNLVAVVHDPQRDQRDLYRSIREQLEVLADVKTDERAEKQLAKVDTELQELHRELTEYWNALMGDPDGPAESFHNLVGRWLAIADSEELARLEGMGAGVRLDDLDTHAHGMDEALARIAKVEWWANPWRDAAGVELATWMGTPTEQWREAMGRGVEMAEAADMTREPTIPAFVDGVGLKEQGAARAELAERIERAVKAVPADVRARWAGRDAAALERAGKRLAEVEPQRAALRGGALDAELAMVAREKLPGMGELASQLGKIEAYLEVAGKWYAFLPLQGKAMGREALGPYGLGLSAANAQRLKAFLVALRARLVLQALHCELYEIPVPPAGLLSDEVLERTLAEHREVIELVRHARSAPALQALLPQVQAALKDEPGTLIEGLRKSPARAAALVGLLDALVASRLIAEPWLKAFDSSLRGGEAAKERVAALAERVQDVESVLRIRAGL
ncbi:MAG TPA: AAA domain-containing protein, partial [Longimicrobiaceae bacterium]|nr:AAA domain-containing protein [Longimicrobiaceae bacterium]